MSCLTVICALLVTTSLGSSVSSRKPRLLDGRIVGGVGAKIEDHPYQLSFQLYGQHFCGASIIGSKWAVTAAHCAGSSAKYYRLSAGSSDKNKGMIYAVERVIPHPKYDSFAIDYDIAVIELAEEFEFNQSIQPVELPDSEIQTGKVVNVTGWGALWQGGGSSKSLQNVEVPIISRELCAAAYSLMNQITPRMICAGNYAEGGKDSCQGDSGGPMVADNVLYGIVSWGYGCARPNYPGVYANVAGLREWIREKSGI